MDKPRYRLRAPAWINGRIEPAGAELTYEGKPGFNLEPMNEPALKMYAKYNPQPEGVPQIKIEPTGPAIGWESVALAAGWSPPGFVKGVESTPAPAPPPERATKPAGAAGVAGSAAAGGNQKPAPSADI